MSEFTGECYHLVQSSGYCEECKKKVRILYTDGMTGKEMEYRDELIDAETPLGEQIDSQEEIEEGNY